MTDLHDLAESAALCTPAQLAAVYRAIEIPQTPAVRRVEDELGPIPDYRQTVERVAAGVAASAIACGLFLT